MFDKNRTITPNFDNRTNSGRHQKKNKNRLKKRFFLLSE